MKATVRVNEFKRVLEEACVVVPKKGDRWVHFYVKVEVSADKSATIAASDGGKHLIQSFEVIGGDVGAFLLHAKQTQDFLKPHVGGTATIEVDDQHTIVKAGTFTIKLPSKNVREFPSTEAMPESSRALSLKLLKRAITQVEPACPNKPGRQHVPSIRVVSDGARLRAVASDGWRIAFADAPGDWGTFEFQIPKTVLPVLKRREGAKVELAQAECNIFLRTESAVLIYSKPVTKFPLYQKADSLSGFIGKLTIQAKELKAAILGLYTVVDLKKPEVVFDVRNGCLQLSTASVGQGSCSLEVKTEGEPCSFRLNPHFVLDALSQMPGEVEVHFVSPKNLVKFSSGSNYWQIIMPLFEKEIERPAEEKIPAAT